MSDPTDYKAEFEKMRDIVHQYRDMLEKAARDAESILRPYLASGAVFGITPEHRFLPIDQLPMKLMGDIAVALAAARWMSRGKKNGHKIVQDNPPLSPADEMQIRMALSLRRLESDFFGANVTIIISAPGAGRGSPQFSHISSAADGDLRAVLKSYMIERGWHRAND